MFDAPTAPPAALASKPAYSQIGRCNCGIYQTRDVSPATAGALASARISCLNAALAKRRSDSMSAWTGSDDGVRGQRLLPDSAHQERSGLDHQPVQVGHVGRRRVRLHVRPHSLDCWLPSGSVLPLEPEPEPPVCSSLTSKWTATLSSATMLAWTDAPLRVGHGRTGATAFASTTGASQHGCRWTRRQPRSTGLTLRTWESASSCATQRQSISLDLPSGLPTDQLTFILGCLFDFA